MNEIRRLSKYERGNQNSYGNPEKQSIQNKQLTIPNKYGN
jgi:hypothetical protein